MGLIEPPGTITEGEIRLAGRSLVGLSEEEYRRVRGRELAMVFQDPMTALNPVQRVGDQIAEAIVVHDGARSRRAREAAGRRAARTGRPDSRRRRERARIRTSFRAACANG